jgi:hypothetical protein
MVEEDNIEVSFDDNNEYINLPNNIINQLKIISSASKSIHVSDVLVSAIKEDLLQSKEVKLNYIFNKIFFF